MGTRREAEGYTMTTPTPQAIERAAQRICLSRGYRLEAQTICGSMYIWETYKSDAYAALTADLGDMVLVPKEPTEEMVISGSEANPTEWTEETNDSFGCDVAGSIYRAMIAAA